MKSFERLQTVPWAALAGFEADLAPGLAAVLRGDPADRILERFLKQHRDATAEQRTALAEAIFGVGLWRRRLRVGRPDATALELLAALPTLTDQPLPLADRFSLPDWLAELIVREAGPRAEAVADALNLPGPICLRANRLRVSREALATRLAAEGVETRPGSWAPDCLVITSPRPNLYGLTAWNQGLFEVQDEGSQLLGELVGAQPGDAVVDLCAGAGGKTLQLAAQLGNRGKVHASDLDFARLERLRTRAVRAGATCVAIHGLELPIALRAQRVLVDAPCSELGALRRGPDLRWRIDREYAWEFPLTQRSLLETGLRHLAPGGRLVYATCTFAREENQELVLEFERAHPELTRVRPELPSTLLDSNGFLSCWPDLHGTDAFFASVHVLS